jgi:hypothetical protein
MSLYVKSPARKKRCSTCTATNQLATIKVAFGAFPKGCPYTSPAGAWMLLNSLPARVGLPEGRHIIISASGNFSGLLTAFREEAGVIKGSYKRKQPQQRPP